MSDGLDVIVLDDEPHVCDVIAGSIRDFHVWGEVFAFTDVDAAIVHCLGRDTGIAIFVLDVFMGQNSGFDFLDRIEERFPSAREDTIMVTGLASDEVVDMCVASDVNHLLEKPLKPYALQLAARAIVSKYLKFARKLMQDAEFAERVARV